METLEIKKEAAIAAHENATSKGKKLLEDLLGPKVFQKEVTDRIKTFEDVLKELGIKSTDYTDYIEKSRGLPKDEIAYQQIKLIVRALNEGWEPDWTNSNQVKYHPYFNMNDSSAPSGFSYSDYDYWFSVSAVGSRLCFKSAALAKYAGTQFTDIYRDFLTLNK